MRGVVTRITFSSSILRYMIRHRNGDAAMLDISVLLTDLILNITVIVRSAEWAARRTDRIRAILIACAVGTVYAVASDVFLSFLVSSYDRSLSSLATEALVSLPIDAVLAYHVTRRRSVKVPA